MTISGNYSTPVQVNGYSCKNCTDVDYAKRHIDPAHPRSGPYDINAKDDPSRRFPDTATWAGNDLSMSSLGSNAGSAGYSAAGRSLGSDPQFGRQLDTTA